MTYLSLYQDKAARVLRRYAERGWKPNGSEKEGKEESEEKSEKEVVFKCPRVGPAGGVMPPAYFIEFIHSYSIRNSVVSYADSWEYPAI